MSRRAAPKANAAAHSAEGRMARTNRPSPRRQGGGAALAVTMVLLFAMTLVAGIANRNHVFELRASANQLRAAQAFEAAEAGVEWALAMLNGQLALDDRCAVAATGGTRFRERLLVSDPATGALQPRDWRGGTSRVVQQAACTRDGRAWTCSCPPGSPPDLATARTPTTPGGAAAGMPSPAFIVQFATGRAAGTVRLLSTGCTAAAGDCQPGSTDSPDATARGCFLIGTAAAESVNDAAVRAALRDGLRSFDAAFETRLRRARDSGELPATADPALLARVASALLHRLGKHARGGVARAAGRERNQHAARLVRVFLRADRARRERQCGNDESLHVSLLRFCSFGARRASPPLPMQHRCR